MFFGNDGGVYHHRRTCAPSATTRIPRINGWTELVNTYGVTQFYGGAGNATSGVIVGGTQDNGTSATTDRGQRELDDRFRRRRRLVRG